MRNDNAKFRAALDLVAVIQMRAKVELVHSFAAKRTLDDDWGKMFSLDMPSSTAWIGQSAATNGTK